MKNLVSIILALLLISSCKSEIKTEDNLLEIDRVKLNESMNSYQVSIYKFVKIAIRASAETDTTTEAYKLFNQDFKQIYSQAISHDIKNSESLSLIDYISIYRDYRRMKGFVDKTDEDNFPTLSDVFRLNDSNSSSVDFKYLSGEEKEITQSIEHAVLSAIILASKDLGREVALYECSKTKPELLPDSELKTLLQFHRGYLFFTKGLYYLSEDEFTKNIEWLENNKEVELVFSRVFFQWGNFGNAQTHTGLHGINHLFRGMDRLMMDKKNDKKRSLEDFEIFLKDFNELGVDNELIWSVETYLYLKKEENKKAIESLKKLRTSPLLSTKEKKQIDESIEYLKNREPNKVLNGLYDKYFLGKIATKYLFSVLSEIDWKKMLKEQDVPQTDEMFNLFDNFNNLTEQLESYALKDNLEETGNELKEKGKSLFNKAKGLIE